MKRYVFSFSAKRNRLQSKPWIARSSSDMNAECQKQSQTNWMKNHVWHTVWQCELNVTVTGVRVWLMWQQSGSKGARMSWSDRNQTRLNQESSPRNNRPKRKSHSLFCVVRAEIFEKRLRESLPRLPQHMGRQTSFRNQWLTNTNSDTVRYIHSYIQIHHTESYTCHMFLCAGWCTVMGIKRWLKELNAKPSGGTSQPDIPLSLGALSGSPQLCKTSNQTSRTMGSNEVT